MTGPFDEPVTLGRATGRDGEVLLRRRDGVDELVVDGVFAMDSAQVSSEVALGRLAGGAARVLVGGLGLGYTVAAVLDDADRTGTAVRVDVVELEPALVTWAREARTDTLGRVASDPRVGLWVGDVGAVLDGEPPGPYGPWDAILLDVDNGPDFLVHAGNAGLYGPTTLRHAYDRLAPGGTLAVWCQGPSPVLLTRLGDLSDSARQDLHHVRRGQRDLTYAICTVRRTGSGPPTVGATGDAGAGGRE